MRVRNGSFILGFLLCFVLLACAGFKYRYYYMTMATYDGKLIAKNPADDKELTVCQPSSQDYHPCVVMLREEFFAMKKDYEKIQTELKWCERNN